jgi:hypothetical protein
VPNPKGRISVRVLPGVFTSAWTVRITSIAPGTRRPVTRSVRAWSLESALRTSGRIENDLRRGWAEQAAAEARAAAKRSRRRFRR